MHKIGFGGGCHWCTEAVFLSLQGVPKVEQGWISSVEDQLFSEAVIVHFLPGQISLQTLIEIHLHTHSSMSNHSMRPKYRSAVYVFDLEQQSASAAILNKLNQSFEKPLITEILTFHTFHASAEEWQNYYYKNLSRPFCETHIHPKMLKLQQQFSQYVNNDKTAVMPIPGK